LAAALDDERREEFHRAFIDFYEGCRAPGGLSSPRDYLLIVGHRWRHA